MPRTMDISSTKVKGNEISGRALAKRMSLGSGYRYLRRYYLRSPTFIGAWILIALLGFVYFADPVGLKDIIFNSWVLIAVIFGGLYGALKEKNVQSAVTVALALAIIVAGVIYFSPLLIGLASPIIDKSPALKDTFTQVIDFVKSGPEDYLKNVLPAEFTKPKSEEPPQRTISVQFINPISRAPLDVISKVGVRTKEDIDLSIQCFLDGLKIDTSPSQISFEGSSAEQFASVTCSHPVSGDKLSMKITAPFEAEAVLGVAVGEGDSLGKVRSTMVSESPYSFTFDLLDTQPLGKRNVPYPLYIKFFRDESNTKLIEVESLQIFPRSGRYQLSCLEPLKSLKFSGRDDKLSSVLLDKSKDAYGFICQLDVLSLPDEGFERSVIEGKVKYSIEKEFKTTLRK